MGEGAKLRQPTAVCDIPRLQCIMAARSAKTLPSDPEYLLYLMSQIGEDSESDDNFDGWLNDDNHERDDETGSALLCRRSMSLESLDMLTHATQYSLSISPYLCFSILYITAFTTSCLSSQKHIMLYYRWLMLPFYLACCPC